MRTIEKKSSVSLCTLVGCIALGACSDEAKLGTSTNVESLEQTLAAVPDDDSEFQAQMTIDANGNVIPGPVTKGSRVVASGFDPRSSKKPLELAEPPRNKVAPSLAGKLRPTDPKAVTEVVVSVAHNAHFPALPKLQRDLPRTSTLNTERLAARVNAIGAVDALRKPSRDGVAAHAKALRATVTEELTMGNALVMSVPDSAVEALANHPDVLEVIPRYDGTPPPATISDGISLATGMNSDYWRPFSDGALATFFMVTFDTGVRSSHTVFSGSDRGSLSLHRDCSRGNQTCDNNPVTVGYSDQDTRWNHGTAVANIIIGGNSTSAGFGLPYRGISKVGLDYINVYDDFSGDAVAVGRAFLRAAFWGDDVIVAEFQSPAGDASAISLAADDAYDQGIATIAACGNSNVVSAPAAPGNAHKALAVGDYDALNGTTVFQRSGTPDGRFKPDFQAPTKVDAAGNASNTAKQVNFNGTSGATAFAGGAAAVMYEWLSIGFGITNKPGCLYSALLAQGDAPTMQGPPNGVGKLKLESGSTWLSGEVILASSIVDVPFTVPGGTREVKVAIWWPERQSDAHNDVDLVLLNPAGGGVAFSSYVNSVWEKVKVTGGVPAGNYTIRFSPYSMPRPAQRVYYTAITSMQ